MAQENDVIGRCSSKLSLAKFQALWELPPFLWACANYQDACRAREGVKEDQTKAAL